MSSWKLIPTASLLLAALAGGPVLAQNPIEVERLETLDPLQVSLPGAALGATLWARTDAALAARVLAALPDAATGAYADPAVADLAAAVLMSGGHPPAGGRGHAELAVLRADRLLAAAGVGVAFDLLERTPALNRSPELSRWHAELAFVSGEHARACRTADALLSGRDEPYWLRARAFCLALDGRAPAAELSAELARGQAADPGFDARLYAITLESGLDADAPGADSGLEWAMSRVLSGEDARLPVLAEDAPAWLLRHTDARAHRHAGPTGEAMARLIEAEDLEGDERIAALESVLAQRTDRELAAEALGHLLDDAQERGRFLAAAHRYGPEISSLPITGRTLADGYRIALAAAVFGDLRTARTWREALVEGPPRPQPVLPPGGLPDSLDKPGAEPFFEPAPLDLPPWEPPSARRMVALDLAIALGSDRLTTGQFEAVLAAWFETHAVDGLAETLALTRLGAARIDGLRLALLETPAIAAPRAAAMHEAARADARAETALLAASLLADPGLAADPDAFSRAIGALDAIGLREPALQIVLERIVSRAP